MKLLRKITDNDFLGTEYVSTVTPRKAVRAVLFDESGLVALLYMGKYDFYTLPGGGVDAGESLDAALKREVLEETGCSSEIVRELGYIEENRAQQDFTQISSYYIANVIGEIGVPSMTQEEIDEDTQLQWHTIDIALELISSPVHQIYQRKYIQYRDIVVITEAIEYLLDR